MTVRAYADDTIECVDDEHGTCVVGPWTSTGGVRVAVVTYTATDPDATTLVAAEGWQLVEGHLEFRVEDASWQGPTVYRLAYSDTLYRLDDGVATALSFAQWQEFGFPVPVLFQSDYVKYPWSPHIYAVTFWSTPEQNWTWTKITYPQWSRAGHPSPRAAGWIMGSEVYQWASSPEIFVYSDGISHKLTFAQWAAMNYRPFHTLAEGFYKLTWRPEILVGSVTDETLDHDLVNYQQWRDEDFPTPRGMTRWQFGDLVFDEFFSVWGDQNVYYEGPTWAGALSYSQWQAAGFPRPVRYIRPEMEDVKCGDFRTQREAQSFFDYYFPDYGDWAGLDGDRDGRACEVLP